MLRRGYEEITLKGDRKGDMERPVASQQKYWLILFRPGGLRFPNHSGHFSDKELKSGRNGSENCGVWLVYLGKIVDLSGSVQ
jgi:hypothetical protein